MNRIQYLYNAGRSSFHHFSSCGKAKKTEENKNAQEGEEKQG